MTELLDNYCNATFPLDVFFADGRHQAHLFCASSHRVYGVSFYPGTDGEPSWSQALDWAGDGSFGAEGRGHFPSMDLAVPPALVDAQCAKYEAEIAEYQARLDANPDAPEAWRKNDEAVIGNLQRMIARLRPETLDQPTPG